MGLTADFRRRQVGIDLERVMAATDQDLAKLKDDILAMGRSTWDLLAEEMGSGGQGSAAGASWSAKSRSRRVFLTSA